MEEKIAIIEDYISQADQIIKDGNIELAKKFQNEVVSVYRGEIIGITDGLDNYNFMHYGGTRQPDFLGDAKLLKMKLINYKSNLKSGLFKVLGNGEGMAITVAQNATQNTTVAVTFEQTVRDIQKIPDNILNAEGKDVLSGKLATISAEKDKQSKWDKVKDVLKWLGDKSVEVGIAALPYIAEALK